MITVDSATPLIHESPIHLGTVGRWMPIPGVAMRARARNLHVNKHNGNATGSVSTWPVIARGRGPWPGWQFVAGGGTGYFTLSPTINLGREYTLFAMAAPTTATACPILGTARFGLMYLNGGLFFHDAAGAELVSISYTPPTDGTFTGFGVVRSASHVRFFINGVFRGSSTLTTAANMDSVLSTIGETNGGGITFGGIIQDVMAAKKPYSDCQMKFLYQDARKDYERTLRRVNAAMWTEDAANKVPWHLFGVSA